MLVPEGARGVRYGSRMKLKLKFIFNIAEGLSLTSEVPVRVCALLMCLLILVAAAASPALPQQSDSAPAAPSARPVDPSATSTLADPPADDATEAMLPHLKDTRFWLSGQANFVFQTHPEFHAPYTGPHSLNPHYEKATSRLMTLYTGARLSNST